MIPALCGLAAIIAILIVFVWLQHREAAKIAYLSTEFLQDRIRKLDAERESLLTRIQAFNPNPVEAKSEQPRRTAVSHGLEDADEPPQTVDELDKRGLKANSGGGFLDEYGHLFEDVQAFDDWAKFQGENRLPKDANPLDFVGGPPRA
jgi:hypothetical protein